MKNITHFFLLIPFILLLSGSPGFAQDTGVLILAHGGSEQWNDAVIEAAEPLKEMYKVEVAFGMANYVSMYHGIQSLEEQGVSAIAVVPLFISSHSLIIRQTEYLLGKRDTLAERPMPLMHHADEYKKMMGIENNSGHSSHSSGGHHFYMPEDLQPIPVEADITIAPALDDHPVVVDILSRRIQELSSDAASETVLLVAHGPNKESDNREWVSTMESLSQKVQALQEERGDPYRQIFALTVRDDAPEPIFEQAKAHLRTLVRQAGQSGRVIVVPLFLSSGGREQAVAERLEGLDFAWNGKTLLPDSAITEFLWQSAEQALTENQNQH